MGCCGKARNIVKGFAALATGKKYEFTDDRVRICQECDRNKWWFGLLFCRECKCFVPAKARVPPGEAEAEDEKCPLDKW